MVLKPECSLTKGETHLSGSPLTLQCQEEQRDIQVLSYSSPSPSPTTETQFQLDLTGFIYLGVELLQPYCLGIWGGLGKLLCGFWCSKLAGRMGLEEPAVCSAQPPSCVSGGSLPCIAGSVLL